MKAHIVKRDGLWRCYRKSDVGMYLVNDVRPLAGIGYTPGDAYADWTYWLDGRASVRAASEPHPPWCSGGCCNPEERA